MATFNLRRFSKPGMLRRIDPEHLIAFLEPYACTIRSMVKFG
jgi:hypothetical protein